MHAALERHFKRGVAAFGRVPLGACHRALGWQDGAHPLTSGLQLEYGLEKEPWRARRRTGRQL